MSQFVDFPKPETISSGERAPAYEGGAPGQAADGGVDVLS